MKTYIYSEQYHQEGSRRICTVKVYRVKRNEPHFIGSVTRDCCCWYGARSEASILIHEVDKLKYRTRLTGEVDKGILQAVWEGKAQLIQV